MLLIAVLLCGICCLQASPKRLSAVMLTVWKDRLVFERSLHSAMKHMHEIDKFFVITPNVKELSEKYKHLPLSRVEFVHESAFPFHAGNVSDVMIEAVRDRGVYPLSGKSQFEKTAWSRSGWFMQQVMKLTAGQVLRLEDYVLLDADVIWFRDITFINSSSSDGLLRRFNYASSSQYHPPYMATLRRIAGVDLLPAPKVFRGGVVHHMVISQHVLANLSAAAERLHGGIPFWKVLLNESALEMTCRAPREGICGTGSTLSEYELYFNYARVVFPETVALRPLLWTNGPMPGLQFWPEPDGKIHSDRHKGNWLGHRAADVPGAFHDQVRGDLMQGYDYVGYHGYAKRRYYELVGPDYEELCQTVPKPVNTTCSWRGFPERLDKSRSEEDWFRHCACFMVNAWE